MVRAINKISISIMAVGPENHARPCERRERFVGRFWRLSFAAASPRVITSLAEHGGGSDRALKFRPSSLLTFLLLLFSLLLYHLLLALVSLLSARLPYRCNAWLLRLLSKNRSLWHSRWGGWILPEGCQSVAFALRADLLHFVIWLSFFVIVKLSVEDATRNLLCK